MKTRKGMGKVRVNWRFGRRNVDHILQSKQGVVEGFIVDLVNGQGDTMPSMSPLQVPDLHGRHVGSDLSFSG